MQPLICSDCPKVVIENARSPERKIQVLEINKNRDQT